MTKLSLAILLCVLAVVTAVYAATPTQTISVQVAWTDNSANEDGFRLYRCAGVNCNLIPVGTFAANTVQAVDIIQGDTGSQVYTYGLTAFNSVGESPRATAVFTTPALVSIPGAPVGINLTVIGVTVP